MLRSLPSQTPQEWLASLSQVDSTLPQGRLHRQFPCKQVINSVETIKLLSRCGARKLSQLAPITHSGCDIHKSEAVTIIDRTRVCVPFNSRGPLAINQPYHNPLLRKKPERNITYHIPYLIYFSHHLMARFTDLHNKPTKKK